MIFPAKFRFLKTGIYTLCKFVFIVVTLFLLIKSTCLIIAYNIMWFLSYKFYLICACLALTDMLSTHSFNTSDQ